MAKHVAFSRCHSHFMRETPILVSTKAACGSIGYSHVSNIFLANANREMKMNVYWNKENVFFSKAEGKRRKFDWFKMNVYWTYGIFTIFLNFRRQMLQFENKIEISRCFGGSAKRWQILCGPFHLSTKLLKDSLSPHSTIRKHMFEFSLHSPVKPFEEKNST